MATPEVLNFATLLAPLAGDNPAGVDLREDATPTSVYYKIKDARTTARNLERQAITAEDASQVARPDWGPILKLGPEILTTKAKDLEITAWIIEGLIRTKGYAGLRDGFRLARELSEQFWEKLYPLPDDYGVETRVFPLTGLNGDDAEGTLIAPVTLVPITKDGYTLSLYKQAAELDRLDPTKREQRIAGGAVTMTVFERSVRDTGADFYRELISDLEGARDEYAKLCEFLGDKCGSAAPPASNIRGALSEALDAVVAISRPLMPIDSAPDGAGGLVVQGGGAVRGGNNGPIATRDDALVALLQVADFFRRTEPHTPVSYALEQAVRWGRMSLPDLLTELVPDQAARDNMFKLVGIRPAEGQQSS
jgi:type VI secretion system protein ImpA